MKKTIMLSIPLEMDDKLEAVKKIQFIPKLAIIRLSVNEYCDKILDKYKRS